MHVRLRGRGNPECPGPVTALHPLAVLDGAPLLVFHFDEAGSLRSGRAVEHDVYVKCWHDVYVTCFCVTCCHRSSYGWMPSLISTRVSRLSSSLMTPTSTSIRPLRRSSIVLMRRLRSVNNTRTGFSVPVANASGEASPKSCDSPLCRVDAF